MNIQVSIKGIRMSPRKVNLVASLVRGRSVHDALEILDHTPKRAARPVYKAVASARSNALNNHRLDEASLMLEQLHVTAGPRLKRYKPAAMGRALPFQKRTSHITISLSGIEKPKKAASKAATHTDDANKEKERE